MDFYRSMKDLKRYFIKFIEKVPSFENHLFVSMIK